MPLTSKIHREAPTSRHSHLSIASPTAAAHAAGGSAVGATIASGQIRGTKGPGKRKHRRMFEYADKLIHEFVGVLLLLVALVVLAGTTYTFITHPLSADGAMAAVGGALIAVIIVEIMRTVHAGFDKGVRRLQTFLVIGIISAVREVLVTSADLSLASKSSVVSAHIALLLASAVVVMCFTASLVLIRRLGGVTPRAA